MRLISSYDASVVVFEVFVPIFLYRRLRRRRRFLGPVVNPPPPPPLSSSPIPQTRRIFLVLRRRLRRRCWVLGTVFLRRHHHCRRQFPGPVNKLPPPPLETLNQARCLFCFLCQQLRCRLRFLRIIFLYRRLPHFCHFLRPFIATPQPPSSSPNPHHLRCRIRSLGYVVYSLSSANASVVVGDSAGQSEWHL